MQPIEEDVEKLLRILLVLVVELFLKLGDYALELERRDRLFTIEPQLLHQLCEANGQFALCAQRVLVVDLFLEVASQEVIREADRVAQALDRAAQVARVVQVPDASQTQPRVLIGLAGLVPLLDHFQALALLFVVLDISQLALLAAVVDLVALTVEVELSELRAIVALRENGQLGVLRVL